MAMSHSHSNTSSSLYSTICSGGTGNTRGHVDVRRDVEEPRPNLTAEFIGQQTPLADGHPPQSSHIHRTGTEGMCDVRNFPFPSGVPV
ncbi:hypothetical protein EYF80_011119 [Liparis tanakae]|uniref:Uncharacterized protein n=1 Tax=Liparis tanakae TaxID=230148 RepID=A0A4Z2ILJ4_9TELE|nr:hypothetical protein EYF80_011119 [Liparis tanakae]